MAGGVLYERDHPLTQLTGIVDLAASRLGSLAVVCGEPGIGKTSLIDAVVARERRDVQIVVARTDPPFGPLGDILVVAGADDLDTPMHGPPLVLVDRVVGAVET